MGFQFDSPAKDNNDAYYYNDGDIKVIRVPLSNEFYGDLHMNHEQLQEWFGISNDNLPDLPAYYISPRLDRFALEISGGENFMEMKADAKATADASVSFEREEYTQEGKVGDEPLVEVAVGLMLRVEKVYTHNINIWADGRGQVNSMSWSGGPGWDDIRIPSRALRRVGGLQFYNFSMSGTGHSSGLYVQTLPVFNDKKELEDIHIALSNKGWKDWYAYTVGQKGKSSGRHLFAYPSYKPSTTIMPVNKAPPKAQ
ncbi:hypothetical protein COL26b_000681 [Colletotrichum chrysophilum]|uniref:uncharacterized protein n=1 Tax=Colletotrichum chrysophilum TaxID=1836956 RepID=UPI00230114EA|nr:uncharacterized protein COL26b_000681 [Colletotrichum chrysophilum]KAJ0380841.1 hypothetical protein COL26b_000681 [Colletotrichum chrysophilum]